MTFPCGHAKTPENTIKRSKRCRVCWKLFCDQQTRARRALRDQVDPGWREKRRERHNEREAAHAARYRRLKKIPGMLVAGKPYRAGYLWI